MAPLDLATMGPVDYLTVEFADGLPSEGTPFRHLARLVQAGTIRLLGLQLVRSDGAGDLVPVAFDDVTLAPSLEGALMGLLAEAGGGVLPERDLLAAAEGIGPGSTGVVIVFENSWAAPFAVALRRAGAVLVEDRRLTIQAFLASLAH